MEILVMPERSVISTTFLTLFKPIWKQVFKVHGRKRSVKGHFLPVNSRTFCIIWIFDMLLFILSVLFLFHFFSKFYVISLNFFELVFHLWPPYNISRVDFLYILWNYFCIDPISKLILIINLFLCHLAKLIIFYGNP